MKLNAIGTSGELIQLGAEGATPWLKNVKAESLRQRDGDTPALRRFFRLLLILLCFLAADLSS